MTNYTFSTLNDKEFETLSRDLLNAKYNLNLQDFKQGKDKGVDLRVSTSKNNNAIVVQAKHYIGSKYSNLKSTLKNTEVKNLSHLKPERYIVVTSLKLSPPNKDEIKEILSPFIQTANDILGQEDLNEILSANPEIEKRYFKLWFSSITVFETVLNNAIEGRTRYLLENIRKKIPYFVVTHKLDNANKILSTEKILLITGQPGIGKTTLAEIMLFDKAKNGFKIYKVENIREAEDVISPNDEEKQIFYFDDFLGANYFEIVNAQKTETQLTNFVDRVKNTPNKYLILTTRTVILNHAVDKYEKIGRSKLSTNQFEIKLEDYSDYEKALILYNRLYFQGIKNEILNTILEKKFYRSIIKHKNFTPRIIEFITDLTRIESFTKEEYRKFIISNLNNPKEIWAYSYNNQINYFDRCLLSTLFCFPGNVSEEILSIAFQNRLAYEKSEHNQIIKTNQFFNSIKILLNGFVVSTIADTVNIIRLYNFINPSLTDYLIGFVKESYAERKAIISSITHVEQLSRFNQAVIPIEKELQQILFEKIENTEVRFDNDSSNLNPNQVNAKVLETLTIYCKDIYADRVIIKHIRLLDFTINIHNIYKTIFSIFNCYNGNSLFKDFVKTNFEIVEITIGYIENFVDALEIPALFAKYGISYGEYLKTPKGIDNIITIMDNVLQSQEYDIKHEQIYDVFTMDQVQTRYENLYSHYYELKESLLPNNIESYEFEFEIDDDYWNEIIKDNEEQSNREYEYDDEDYYQQRSSDYDIDELFS